MPVEPWCLRPHHLQSCHSKPLQSWARIVQPPHTPVDMSAIQLQRDIILDAIKAITRGDVCLQVNYLDRAYCSVVEGAGH